MGLPYKSAETTRNTRGTIKGSERPGRQRGRRRAGCCGPVAGPSLATPSAGVIKNGEPTEQKCGEIIARQESQSVQVLQPGQLLAHARQGATWPRKPRRA